MTTAPLSQDELRRQVEEVVAPYGLSVDDFVRSDIDELPTDELRDLWLMVEGAVTTAA